VNGKQHAVMWLGLVLIMVRMWSTGQAQAIWAQIVTPGATAPGKTTPKKPNCSGLTGLGRYFCEKGYAGYSSPTQSTGNGALVTAPNNTAIPT
jgi:hypothetical protein